MSTLDHRIIAERLTLDRLGPWRVRADVEARMKRQHFLRNRIAHHEPIHERDLASDHRELLEVVGWICADSRAWVESASRTPTVLSNRPPLA